MPGCELEYSEQSKTLIYVHKHAPHSNFIFGLVIFIANHKMKKKTYQRSDKIVSWVDSDQDQEQ